MVQHGFDKSNGSTFKKDQMNSFVKTKKGVRFGLCVVWKEVILCSQLLSYGHETADISEL
jgi:hypothetical protein